MVGWLDVTNVGPRPCLLDGTPRLIELRSGSSIIASVAYAPEPGPGPGESASPAAVLIRPGDRAGAMLMWTNWCAAMRPVVGSLLVTLPSGGSSIEARPSSPGPGFFGVPRCDQPTAGSTLTSWSFVPEPPPPPPYEPQPASVALSVPPSAAAGGDLAFVVTLTNDGTAPASLQPCPTYTEDLLVAGRALKPPASEQFQLDCAAIGGQLSPGASLTLQMHYPIPADVAAGPVELVWGMDPGGPFDASTAVARAPLAIVRG